MKSKFGDAVRGLKYFRNEKASLYETGKLSDDKRIDLKASCLNSYF